MEERKLVFRVHAIRRMFERGISTNEVREAVETGEVIENYPDDEPYPSRLILGRSGSRPLHVVAAENGIERTTLIVTVYEPDPSMWEPDFRQRRKR